VEQVWHAYDVASGRLHPPWHLRWSGITVNLQDKPLGGATAQPAREAGGRERPTYSLSWSRNCEGSMFGNSLIANGSSSSAPGISTNAENGTTRKRSDIVLCPFWSNVAPAGQCGAAAVFLKRDVRLQATPRAPQTTPHAVQTLARRRCSKPLARRARAIRERVQARWTA
jgi:hypothetical protein